MDKNYNIDIFHFDDYLNKQLMGISENQLLMLHVKLMVIFLFPLKASQFGQRHFALKPSKIIVEMRFL